ncbi:Protein FAM136A [Trichoplax sp. H2]|nr:Protein FAM136A [Trichoplax sp. H2]|eukprot:RDD42746.1 Protein FAM136A [Trichoplax sp. H2]
MGCNVVQYDGRRSSGESDGTESGVVLTKVALLSQRSLVDRPVSAHCIILAIGLVSIFDRWLMMESVASRASAALEEVVKEVEDRYIRKLQADCRMVSCVVEGKAYRCCAACCENKSLTGHLVQDCVTNCVSDVNRAQEICNQEFGNFQERLNRCALDCQDKIKDKMSSNMNDVEMSKLTKQMEQCFSECVDTRIKLLAKMRKRLASQLDKMVDF